MGNASARPPSADSPLFRDEALARIRAQAWQPALLSRRVSGAVLAATALGVGAAVAVFAAKFEFAHKEHVRGHLRPADGWTRVEANAAGVVGRRLVHPGDAVRAGDVLLEVSPAEGLGKAMTTQQGMLGRIADWHATLGARLDLVDARHDNEFERLTAETASERRLLAKLETEIELSKTLVRLADQRWENARRLVSSGALAADDAARIREQVQSRRLALAERRRDEERLRASLRAKEQRSDRISIDRDMDRSTLQEKLHALALDELRLRGEAATMVLAPRAGIVYSVRVDAGDVVRAGKILLDIVAEDNAMAARLYAPPAAMGYVRSGQPVRVYIDAFPYERHGAQSGRVAALSQTAIIPEGSPHGSGEPVYQIDVAFPDDLALTPIQRRALRPGMTVTADLIRDRGTLVDWLLEPLRTTSSRL